MDIIASHWNELPEELLDLIFKRLPLKVSDIFRFGAVCRSWRSLLASEAVTQVLKPGNPTLLLPPGNNNEASRFFDLSKSKEVEIQLDGVCVVRCCNSWNGWLFTVNSTPPYAINSLHITTGAQIQLPPATAFEHPPSGISQLSHIGFIKKVITSSAPSNPDCIVMIYKPKELAFCKPGDEKWTTLNFRGFYHDIIHYNDHFFATLCDGELVQFKIGEKKEPEIIPFAPHDQREVIDYVHLVESSGDLLKVVKNIDYGGRHSGFYKSTFDVFKLNLDTRKWNQVNDLGGRALFLGNHTLFLGHNISFSICTKDFSECRQYCIYYLREQYRYCSENPNRYDIGVFNLKS